MISTTIIGITFLVRNRGILVGRSYVRTCRRDPEIVKVIEFTFKREPEDARIGSLDKVRESTATDCIPTDIRGFPGI